MEGWYSNFYFKGTIILSIGIDLFEMLKPLTTDRFLGCIFGGIINGIGNSLVLRVNGSTGGTEVVTGIIRAYNKKLRTSSIIGIFDIAVVALNVIFFKQFEIGLYSAIAIYMSIKMVDLITIINMD